MRHRDTIASPSPARIPNTPIGKDLCDRKTESPTRPNNCGTIISVIIFDSKSAYKHFEEDRLDEDEIRRAMAHPEWIALIDPADPSIPPGTPGSTAALVICLRRPGAWHDDLIEVLARPQGRDMLVFHVEYLTGKWRDYWMKWRR